MPTPIVPGGRSTTAEQLVAIEANSLLTPYVPRLVIEWLREHPGANQRTVEGSLLFADISGFTRLSEALARRGKLGAELMRDSLNGVFTALLDDAYDFGSGLIKWGGDAVLLLFDGDDHAARACRAAWEMQRTIARVGRLRTPGGTVVLQMSIGIASGPIQFFLVGGVHRELLVAGPTATKTVEMEAIADPGEIALSPELASGMEPVALAGRREEAVLLANAPDVPRRRAPDVGDVSEIDIAGCIPVAARAHVLLDRSEPEHRTITAAFIDLIGTDEALAGLGPDLLAAELDEQLRTIQEAALQFEVPFYETDVGKGSVKVLLTGGAPSSTGRDEERVLRALRAIVETPGRIPVRAGVNTGRVFAGDFGPPYRRAYRVFGDAINTAARVMSRAEPGQVLATDVVLARSRTLFATVPIEPFAAKGKALPIQASVVGPVAGRREALVSTDFLGREAELATLAAAIDSAPTKGAWTLEVSGRPGMGVSRLVEELIGRSPGVEVYRGRGDEYQSATPYFPLRAAFRSILGLNSDADHETVESGLRTAVGERAPHLVPWLPLLAVPFGLVLAPTPVTRRLEERFVREKLAELVFELLAALLADRRALLLIEDAHRVDEATLDLLAAFERLGRDGGRNWSLLLTQADSSTILAPESLEADGVRWAAFSLLPLTPDCIRDLIHRLTDDDPLPPHLVDELARRSGGNVVFALELLALAKETRSVTALPDSVEALATAEIDRLAPRDRDLLRYASVLGARFDPELLAAALHDELEVDEAAWLRLQDLIEADPTGGRRFRNPLTHAAAYEGLPYRRRRHLHAWLGEALETRAGDRLDEEAGTLAIHFHEAQVWAKAWLYARRAAERASAVYANVEAATHWQRAVEAGRRNRPLDRPQLASAYEALADIYFRLGEFGRSERALGRARELVARGSADAGVVALKEAMIPFRFGNYPRTLRRLSRGLSELEGVRGRAAAASRARLAARYAAVRFRQNRLQEAITWCGRARLEARRGKADDALAYALMIHDLALLAQGRPAAARRCTAALRIYRRIGDLVQQAATLNNMGLIAYERGRWSEALQLYEEAGRIWESTGDVWSASFAMYNSGEILSDQGSFDEAEQRLRTVLRVWRAAGSAPEIAQATRQLGRLAARRGQHQAASELLESARRQQVNNGEAAEALATELWIAEALVLAGEPEAAVEAIAKLEARTRELDPDGRLQPLLLRIRGWALLSLGADAEADAAFAGGLRAANGRSAGFELAALLEGAVLTARARSRPATRLESRLETKMAGLGIAVRPAGALPMPEPA